MKRRNEIKKTSVLHYKGVILQRIINKIKAIGCISISIILTGLILLTLTSSASASDYYVATWGNNNNPGTLALPWQTIDYGADHLSPGDTAWIMSGTYNKGFITISSSGTASNPKNIRKYDGTVVIDGKDATGKYGIDINGNSYWNIQGIDMKNIKGAVYFTGKNTHHINISNCEISKFIGGIGFNKGAHDITLYDVSIHTLYSGSGNTIDIFGDKDDPSKVTKNISIINCDIYDNNRHNGINFGPATGGGNPSWYGKYVIDGILIENTKVYGIAQQAVFCNFVTVNNLSFMNNKVYDSTKGVRLTLIDSILCNNEVYGIRNGNPMSLQYENGDSHNVLFDQNYIHDSPGSAGYYAIELRKAYNTTVSNVKQHGMAGDVSSYGGSVSDRIIKDIYKDKYKIKIEYKGSGATIEYSNGDVFELSGSGTIKGPIYNPSKSSATVKVDYSNVITVRHYGMTVQPQETLTSIKVNKFDSSKDIYDWTVTSSKAENPVWFNVVVQSGKCNYEVQRDGKYFTTISSDSNKNVKFYYNEDGNEWDSSHTFRIIKSTEPAPTPTPTPTPTQTPTPTPTQTPTPTPTQIPTPTPTGPPVLNPIGTKSVNINSLLEFTIIATDPNGDALTYSATGLPSGASFDPSTATFSWTPGEGQEGLYQVHLEVTDGSLVDSEEITIKVNKKGAQVVLNGIDNRMREVSPNTVFGATTWVDIGKIGTNNYNSVLLFDLSKFKSTDHIESATLSLLWYYESREQNTEVSIYRPAEWDPDYVTWNTRTNGVQWNNPGGDWYDRNNAAQGAEAYDTVVFLKDTAPDGQYHNFDVTQLVQSYVDGTYENTGLLIKADKENDGYIAFYSSDWSDANQRPKVTITYKPGDKPVNQAPVLDPIGNKTVETGNMVEFEINASDPNSDALIYSATGLPGGANFENHIFSWTPDKGQAGSYHVHFEVTDGSLIDTEDVTITVSVTYPPYDINEDGIIDILDITLVVDNYGTTTEEPYPRYDVNTDGIVDIKDLDCVASHFGEISR